MWTLSLACLAHAGLLISAQSGEDNTPSSVPTPMSFEPTPVYFYNPPNSNINHYAPRHQEESPTTYFGPAIGVGLVFTFIFIHYWRKHRNNEENEALFLDDDEEDYLAEELVIEGVGRESQTGGGAVGNTREIALTTFDSYKVCNDVDGVSDEDEDDFSNNNTSANPICQSQTTSY